MPGSHHCDPNTALNLVPIGNGLTMIGVLQLTDEFSCDLDLVVSFYRTSCFDIELSLRLSFNNGGK